jgi:glycine/D-amino acid oxidase-like deaminating enzyme
MKEQPARPHVIVIGAGIVGASIAFNLAERGAQVTILDAADPGQGASTVSFAWLNGRDKNPRHYHDLNRRSVDMWPRFARRLGGDVGLTWGGELRWAATEAGAVQFTERVRTLQSWGYPIQLLTAAELKQLEPDLVTGPVAAASYSSLDGQVDTGRVVRACLTGAQAGGAVLRSHTPVTGFRQTTTAMGQRRIEAVLTDDGDIGADAVVLAGGPDSAALAALAGIDLPLHHTFGASIITEPIAPLFRNTAVLHTPADLEPLLGFRQFADGSVMIHGGDGSTRRGSLGQTEAEVERVVAAATSFLPALEGVKVKEVRQGRRPIPNDGQPILGFAQAVPNLYLAVTHSGVTLAALIGELTTIELLDHVRVDWLEPYRLERFV